MGYRGIAIDFENVVIAERYGNLPEGGVSFNYSEGKRNLVALHQILKAKKKSALQCGLQTERRLNLAEFCFL